MSLANTEATCASTGAGADPFGRDRRLRDAGLVVGRACDERVKFGGEPVVTTRFHDDRRFPGADERRGAPDGIDHDVATFALDEQMRGTGVVVPVGETE